ncbi:hypothetical protein DL764_004242 [Monosporascus ibericus]|uniref:Uncharacterized protein n=1 Tax=Monosporascus ibericus TaxID=155417 RepID=A0A4Q4THI6_9PEZI|nr:hypothetical protein DL764_004242 [Monosporascus ibericus]
MSFQLEDVVDQAFEEFGVSDMAKFLPRPSAALPSCSSDLEISPDVDSFIFGATFARRNHEDDGPTWFFQDIKVEGLDHMIVLDYNASGQMDHMVAWRNDSPTSTTTFSCAILKWEKDVETGDIFLKRQLPEITEITEMPGLEFVVPSNFIITSFLGFAIDWDSSGRMDHFCFGIMGDSKGLAVYKRDPSNNGLSCVFSQSGTVGDLAMDPSPEFGRPRQLLAIELDNHGKRDGLLQYDYVDFDIFRHRRNGDEHWFERIYKLDRRTMFEFDGQFNMNIFWTVMTPVRNPVTGAEQLYFVGGHKAVGVHWKLMEWDPSQQTLVEKGQGATGYGLRKQQAYVTSLDYHGTGHRDHLFVMDYQSHGTPLQFRLQRLRPESTLSYYGIGAIYGWRLVLLSVLTTWTFNSKFSRTDPHVTVDLSVVLITNALAVGDALVRFSRRPPD